MSGFKDALYEQVQRDSQNAKHLGQDLNLGFLEEEAKKNEKNPGRAIGKAATAAATWYLGGPAWGAAGNAAGSAVPPMAEMGGQTAINAANAMQPAMAGLQGMESALTDTGYTPSSLMNAFKYGQDSGQGMGQTMGNWASNKGMGLMHRAQNNPMGLLGGDGAKRYALNQGMNMMQPQQPMQAPPPPPPRQQQQPMMTPYLTEEQKRMLMAQGYSIY